MNLGRKRLGRSTGTLGASANSFLPYSVNFASLSDGALPARFTGTTWTISGGKAINTPVLGTNIITHGNMESGSPPSGWSPNGATLTADSDAHSGSVGLKTVSNALAASASSNISITKDKWYVHETWIKVLAGQADLILSGGYYSAPYHVSPATYTYYRGSLLSTTTTITFFLRDFTLGSQILWDDVTLYPLTISELISSIDARRANVTVKANIIGINYNPIGVVCNLDSQSNPKYFMLAVQNNNTSTLFKVINGVYTQLLSVSVTGVSGAAIEIRKTANNIYQLWYNGVQRGIDQTVTDANLNSNTLQGIFSTGGGPQISKFFITSGLIDTVQAVAIGGSITFGSSASDPPNNSYHALLATYLRSQYQTKNVLMSNAGVSATGSTYGLIRLQTDVIALNPELVVIDFAVNDSDETYYRSAAEAMIRRLRIALPNAKLCAVFFLEVSNPANNIATNLREAVKQNWITLCNRYGIPYADFAGEVARAVAAGEHTVSEYMNDTVHPKNLGHSTAGTLLESVVPRLFAGPQVSSTLPDRIYDNGDYENQPIVRYGIDNDGETGTGWTTSVDGTSRESSTTDDTMTYTGTFQMIIRDMQIGGSNGTVATQIDGGAWTNINLASDGSNYRTHWYGTRALHTVVFKVVSGRVKIRRFLAI